jgi:DNA-binding NarL/FixJ family response regulator
MASRHAVTPPDVPNNTVVNNLSIVVVADASLRRRCHAILAAEHITSRGATLAGARRVLRRYRPNVLLLDATRSPRRALAALPPLRRLSRNAGVLLLGRRRASGTLLVEAACRGAWGHLAARDLSRDLPKAVRMVADRQCWLPRRLSAAIVAELIRRSRVAERN